MKSLINPWNASQEGELFAGVGEAKLIKKLGDKGAYYILDGGGSEADRAELEKWISMFMKSQTIERLPYR